MILIESETYDDMQRDMLGRLLYEPEYVGGVKGATYKEALSAVLRLRDPLSRISTSPVRNMNYAPIIGQLLSVYNVEPSEHELSEPAKKLMADANARDAVFITGRGVWQFFIRNSRLHMNESLTESDAVWSLTDHIFLSTVAQELLLLDLLETYPTLAMGEYVLTVGSLYLYERHYELAAALQAEERSSSPRMEPIKTREDLYQLAHDERALREHRLVGVGGYQGGATWMFDRLLEHRMGRESAMMWPAYRQTATA